jgi:CBS domain-containing protein
MQKKSLLYGSSDHHLFTTRVGAIAKAAVTVSEDTTIREAAGIMTAQKVSSLIVLDKRNLPVGIMTDRDLREKVVAMGRSTDEPVRNIMTISLIRADADDFCFEAVLKMIKYNIHNILVIKEGALQGIMTNHDIMLLQGTSPLSIAHSVDNQQNIYGLANSSGRINSMLGLLLKEGAKAASISTIITEINDRLVRKVLEIGERQLGQPPVPYCWVVLGSEGRKEQIFKTDQDNAIIFADPSSSEEEDLCRKYFAGLTAFVSDALRKVGYPDCPDGYMAANPQWCQSLKTWKSYYYDWIQGTTAESVVKSLIFFDVRPLYGKSGLSDELKNYSISLIRGNGRFLGLMAERVTKNTPPIGFFNAFVVEKDGDHKDKFDIKMKGTRPLVDAVRLIALDRGIKETSTLGRLKALKGKGSFIDEHLSDLEQVFEFIMLLRIHHRFEQVQIGKEPDNFINPGGLGTLEKKTIKEGFHLIAKLQGLIIDRFKAGVT